MKTVKLLPALLLGLLATGCVVAPVGGEVVADSYYGDSYADGYGGGTHVQVRVSSYPDLVLVPGSPVYYAPAVSANYFFFDGLYWVFSGDNWYSSYWYNGPWSFVRIDYVPVYILRVPVYYYRRPPAYFRPWQRREPPRWGERWGREWESRHPGWQRPQGATPAPAPRPDYQRGYGGRRYPAPDEQRRLRERFYPHQPREGAEPPRARPGQEPWQQRQQEWQQRRQEQQEQDRRERQSHQQQLDEQRRERDQGRPQGPEERDPARGDERDAQRQEQYERWRQREQDVDPRFQRDPARPQRLESDGDGGWSRGNGEGGAVRREPPQWQRPAAPRVTPQAPVVRERAAPRPPQAGRPEGRPARRGEGQKRARPQPQQDEQQERNQERDDRRVR